MLRTFILGMTFVAGWHLTLPVIAIYAKALGAGPFLVGVTVSSTLVLPLFLAIFVGAIADLFGTRRLARVSALIFTGGYALVALGDGISALIVGLALAGLADIGLVVAAQTYVATHSTPETRDRNFGMLTVWMSLGGLAGPILGGSLTDLWGYQAPFAATAALGALAFAITWILPPDAQRPAGAGRASLTGPLRTAGEMLQQRAITVVLLTNAFMMFAFSLRASFVPIYLEAVGLSATLIGVIFSVNSFSSMAVRPTIGVVVRRFGYVPVFGFAIGLTVVALGLIPQLTTFWPLAAVMGMGGAAMGYVQPLAMSLIAGRAPAGSKGVSLGLRISVMQLAQVVAPVIFGAVVTGLGLAAAFYAGAIVAAGGFLPLAAMTKELAAGGGEEAEPVPSRAAAVALDSGLPVKGDRR